jgi:hypothetical protein
MTRYAPNCRQLVLLAILLCIGQPLEWAPAADPKSNSLLSTQINTQHYVAVMGQVVRPAVFEFQTPLPQLVEFLNLTGGLTSQASGSIRIIRGGRSHQFFLSPRLSLQLIADDLVIVESNQFVAGRRRNAGLPSAAPPPTVVQIGLVNLISRPVILDLPGEQADLAQLLSVLHQPLSDKAEITVFKPGSGMQAVPLSQAFETTLATGSVLMFDPTTVNRGVLPRLPNTIRLDAQPEAVITRSSVDSTLAAGRASAANDPIGHSSNAESARLSPAAWPLKTAEQSGAGEFVDLRADSNEPAATDEIMEALSEAAPVAPGEPPTISARRLVILMGTVACCLGMAMVMRFKRQMRSRAASSLPQPIRLSDDLLESLISGSLPIVVEPLPMPYEAEIFGRPVQASVQRTDFSHPLSRPHYLPRPSLPTNEDTTPAEKIDYLARSPAGGNVRVDVGHTAGSTGVLDRALASIQGAEP